MGRDHLRLIFLLFTVSVLASCERNAEPSSAVPTSDYRFMTAVSDEVIIDSEPTFEENLDKALEIVRTVCEEGSYSVSCAEPNIVPPMNIDRDNLVPVELQVNQMVAEKPNYIFIRCESDVNPPPTNLVEELRQNVCR